MILLIAAAVWMLVLAVAWRRARHELVLDLLAIGLIGVATVLFFWRLLAGQVWIPAGGGDLAQFLFPTYSFAATWWRRGVVPLWNPYLFGGAPFVGDSQSGILYPLNLLTFLVSAPLSFRDMEFLAVLHFFIAGAGTYAFLRWGKLGRAAEQSFAGSGPANSAALARMACLAGAIAYEFSDLFITHFGNLNLIAVAAWLPLVLLFFRRAIVDRSAGLAAMAGVVLAVAFSAGHPQIFLFVVLALILWTLFEMIAAKRAGRAAGGDWSDRVPPVLARFAWVLVPGIYLALVAAVAIGLSAPSLLPVLEMAQHTVRAAYPYEQAAQFSVPPAGLIGLLVPGFFGRGAADTWAPWPRVEVGYIGILPLLLALLALVLRRDSTTRFLGVFAFLGMALAFGGYSILHGWLYQFIPGFGQLRAPARFVVLFDFGVAALAAFGMDTLLHALPHASEIAFRRLTRAAPWAFALVALAGGTMAYTILVLGQGQDPALFRRMVNAVNGVAFFVLLLALALALIVARGTRFFRSRAWGILALALIFFDLFSLGAYVDTSTDDPMRVYDHPDAAAFLKNAGGLDRVDPRGTGVDSTWPADNAILYGLFSVDGDNPLVLGDFDRYWQSLGSRSTRLYDLLNVRYVIGRKGVTLDDKFKLAYDGDPAVNIYENTGVLPRAFLVPERVPASNVSAALDAIHAEGFDPRQTVVVEANGLGAEPVRSNSPADSGAMAMVEIVGYGPNEILMQATAVRDSTLVLSEVYYPGWSAWVDDRPVLIWRADGLFRAVDLPAGQHRVRFLYDPGSFKAGVGLFAATVLVLVVWGARNRTQTSRRFSSLREGG